MNLDRCSDTSRYDLRSEAGELRATKSVKHSLSGVKGFLANVRSLRQAAGDVRKLIACENVDVFVITESHLKDDPVKSLLPSGYKVVFRYDRTLDGGGVVAGCRSHFLASPLDLAKYCVPKDAELTGVELDGVDYIGCYTSNSSTAYVLIERCIKYMMDHPHHPVVLMRDFNLHHSEWLGSQTNTDRGGIDALAMCEMFDLNQLVHFPTRGNNTLDLILTPFDGLASQKAHAGTSDHLSITFEVNVPRSPDDAPDDVTVRDWERAPWHHIKGAIKRYLKDWDPCAFPSPSMAQSNLSEWIDAIIDRYVPTARAISKSNAPWWNYHCEKAFKQQQKIFQTEGAESDAYRKSVMWNRNVQKKAFKVYNIKLRNRLRAMGSSDRTFWNLVKEIGGLDRVRSAAAPEAEALASHFATKMTSGKDRPDDNFSPRITECFPISNFKIRFPTVLKSLSQLDPSKSANDAGPSFLRECAAELAPLVNRLFKYVVKAGSYR